MILDVGCGNDPKGTVNCDLFLGPTIHRWKMTPIHKKRVKNLIRADGQHLPFRDNCFEISYSSHTLEHVDNPELMISEMERVSKNLIIIITPLGWLSEFSHVIWRKIPSGHKHRFWGKEFVKRKYKIKRRIRLIKPTILRNKKFPIPIYPMFELVAWKWK